jgi:hypothetical protein
VVFDGYQSGPNIKDREHQRRAAKHAPDRVFDCSTAAYNQQAMFLANDKNKAAFVMFIKSYLINAGHTVHQAKDDADTLIVKTALNLAKRTIKQPVTVVANDTDMLVLLVFHFTMEMSDIHLMSQTYSRKAFRTSATSICDVCRQLGPSASRQVLVIHALSRCDTTSSLFELGKPSVWKK